jgi:hypothetical protein
MQMPSFLQSTSDSVGGLFDGVKESMSSGLLSTTKNGLFNSQQLGSTLQGLGSIAGGIGSYFAMKNQADYQDKLYNQEKERIDKESARQEKFDTNMTNSFS